MSQPGYPHQNAPPPYGMHPPPPQQPTVVIVGGGAGLGSASTTIQCPSCHATVKTRVEREATTRTHLIALVMCLFVCWPCCLFPYCIDSCKGANHYCPSCGAYVGAYAN
ncbi:lipopolysaccharide-induced tumor necrosis factor-alpha factor homolog [Bacillus rossius redtenbacheri]|uniref:lipopolysaccharide-induced tumor necrosis factor-alpha factor homolog n=1 Tax=Bacillus rossius redtenbacheri TaxID=93214 RepID=UPI002FDD565A